MTDSIKEDWQVHVHVHVFCEIQLLPNQVNQSGMLCQIKLLKWPLMSTLSRTLAKYYEIMCFLQHIIDMSKNATVTHSYGKKQTKKHKEIK